MMLDRPDPLPFYERVWLRQTTPTHDCEAFFSKNFIMTSQSRKHIPNFHSHKCFRDCMAYMRNPPFFPR